jgi:hypothetical protein
MHIFTYLTIYVPAYLPTIHANISYIGNKKEMFQRLSTDSCGRIMNQDSI